MELEIKGLFTRAGPPGSKLALNSQKRALDFNQLDDCITGQQLLKFVEFDCNDPENLKPGKGILIPWTQVFNPNLILGQKKESVPIIRKIIEVEVEKEKNETIVGEDGKVENRTVPYKDNITLQNETVYTNA